MLAAAGTCGLLLTAAVLLWPRRSAGPAVERTGAAQRDEARPGCEAPGDSQADLGVTAAEVADALTLLALTLRSGRGTVESLEDVGSRLPTVAGYHLRVVAAGLRWGLEAEEAWAEVPQVWRPARAAWCAAVAAGAAPAELLLRAATSVRDAEDRRVESAIASAGTLLVVPLGLALLPGFVATTVVPVVVRLVTAYAQGP